MRERRGIFRQYVKTLAFTAGALVAVAGAALTGLAYQTNQKHIANFQVLELRLVQARLAVLFDNIERHLIFISSIPWTSPSLSLDDRALEYRQALTLLQAVMNLRLFDASGIEILAVARNQPTRRMSGEQIDSAIVAKALATRAPVFSLVKANSANLQPYVDLAIADKSSTAQVSIARINLQSIAGTLASLSSDHGGVAYILDAFGNLVAHSDSVLALRHASTKEDPALLAIFSAPRGLSNGQATITRNGLKTVITWRSLGRSDWTLVHELEATVVFSSVYQALWIAGILLVLSLIAAVLVSYFLAKRLSQPVVALSESAQKLATGDLSHRVSVDTATEFSTVAASFNFMAGELETAHSNLRDRIAIVTESLQKEFERREQDGRAIAKLEERARIMRDLHDGVGGHLVGLLGALKIGQIDSGQIAVMLQDALVDFRIAIDSLSPSEPDFETAIANLKHRLTSRLAATDLEAVWQIEELPEELRFTQEQVFHVQRIIVEAITNVIKHARYASFVKVLVVWRQIDKAVVVEIFDDGEASKISQIGQVGTVTQSRGLGNMQARAKAIGGSISFEDGSPCLGFRVTLLIPSAVLRGNADKLLLSQKS
jgi:signal transduction histidine kinase